jgi:hypothetical protein
MRRSIGLLVAATALAWSPTARAGDLPVDIELVLAVDISDSMDPDEQALQRRGYRAAMTDGRILDAIQAGRWGRIAVTYVEWAGASTQRVVVPWMLIDGAASAAGFARQLREPLRTYNDGTAIGAALAFSGSLFGGNGFATTTRIVDISGDGANNVGPPVAAMRDALVARGVTINGLPILIRRGASTYSIPDLFSYYRDCVTGGAAAFVEPVRRPGEFEDAILRKLAREIALKDRLAPPVLAALGAAPSDCTIGERMGGDEPDEASHE